jgi:hypothetical protein
LKGRKEKGKREREKGKGFFFWNIPQSYIQLGIFLDSDYWKPQKSEKTGEKNFFFLVGVMEFVILMVMSFFGLVFDSIVGFVNVLGAVARLVPKFILSTLEPAELEFCEFSGEAGKLFREFHFSTPDPANVLEWLLLEEPEEERQEQEEQQEEEVEPCEVCGSTFCSECELFRRINWSSFSSGERVIDLEDPIRDEGRLRQYILERDPDVDVRIRNYSYYDDGICVDEIRVFLTKYPATKSALKN